MKIIHVSDRHYGQPGATTANSLLNNAIAARPDIADCIIVDTGDVVDTPDESVYRTATSALAQLADRCADMVMVPGNHDLNVMGITPHPTAHIRWGSHVERLTSLCRSYPFITLAGGIAIIAVDSNRPPRGAHRLTQNFTATGYIGRDQIEDVVELVRYTKSRGLPVIVAMHHCPSGGDALLRLHDRDAFGEALADAGGVDLILTGHLHQRCEWSDVFGARYLLSSPKSPSARGY